MISFKPTIGLEIHAELQTETKLFCDSKNDPDEKRPNVNICPVCMAHPGTLPVINKAAIKHVIRIGYSLGAEIADFTEFDRKNYFYPDIPKGYQISQYKYPIVSGGSLNNIAITRVHLEEDTARSIHRGDHSLIDFNRAGVPLMELVTEPLIRDAGEASSFAREFQLLLRTLNASKANLEKGELRVEANVSIHRENDKMGTKVEVKNLNSFKAVERAIAYEIGRQKSLLTEGKEVIQETRGWDENRQQTFSQRIKEESQDYRYFPEPDLPKLRLSEIPSFSKKSIESTLPEMPWETRSRYAREYKLTVRSIDIILQNESLQTLFEGVVKNAKNEKQIKLVINYITSDLVGLIQNKEKKGDVVNVKPKDFYKLINLISNNIISSRVAKDILDVMYMKGGDPEAIVEDKSLHQLTDDIELSKIAREILKANDSVARNYREGKEAALKYLVGQGMKKHAGAIDPKTLAEVLKKQISSG
jgi:aspartyl-tRNA(Asn)/glutamyl-tRNA(Gln) amidotransferase subunit B